MDRSRSHLAFQCASIALLSVSLWYLYRIRRRHLSEAATRREWDLRNLRLEMEGLQDAGLDDEDQECCQGGSRVSDAERDEDENEGPQKSSRCCNESRCNKSTCTPNKSGTRAESVEQVQHGNSVKPLQAQDPGVENVMEGKILFASQTGTAKRLAEKLLERFVAEKFSIELVDPSNYEPEDLARERLIILVTSTWENGSAPQNASFLGRWLEESSADFRVGSWLLRGCKYAIFGLGNKAYGSKYNLVARSWDRHMAGLGASPILHRGEADEDDGDVDRDFEIWADELVKALKSLNPSQLAGFGDLSAQKDGTFSESGSDYYTDDDLDEDKENAGLIDVEDVVRRSSDMHNELPKKSSKWQVFRGKNPKNGSAEGIEEMQGLAGAGNEVKEMVTPTIRSNLEKQVNSSFSIDCNTGEAHKSSGLSLGGL